MTRPIEKVKRDSGCQLGSLLLNLFVLALFISAGILDSINNRQDIY